MVKTIWDILDGFIESTLSISDYSIALKRKIFSYARSFSKKVGFEMTYKIYSNIRNTVAVSPFGL